MTLPTTTRKTLRQSIIKLLYQPRHPIVSSVTADSIYTVITDSLLFPGSVGRDFARTWIFISSQPTKVDSGKNINEGGDFTASDTTLTMEASHGIVVNDAIQIEDEILLVTAVSINDLTVTRGHQSTTAALHSDGTDVYIIGPAIEGVSRVFSVDFSTSNSDLILSPAFVSNIKNTAQYEVHYKFHPSVVNEAINELLDTFQHPLHIPVTLVTDGDMRTTDVTNWTAAGTGGTPTLAKSTSTVRHGSQSLSITNDGSTTRGFAKSASMNVKGGKVVLVSCDVFITAGDNAKITLYDVTNSADIDTAESAATGWATLYFSVNVPATCEQMQIWLEAEAVSDVVYFDHAIVWVADELLINPLSTLEYGTEVDRVVYFPRGRALSATGDDNAYAIDGAPPEFYSHFAVDRDDSDVVPHRIQLTGVENVVQPLWLKAWIDYPELSVDTDTTVMNKDIIKNLVTADLLDQLAIGAEMDEQPDLAERMTLRAIELRQEVFQLTRQFAREPKGRVRGAFR